MPQPFFSLYFKRYENLYSIDWSLRIVVELVKKSINISASMLRRCTGGTNRASVEQSDNKKEGEYYFFLYQISLVLIFIEIQNEKMEENAKYFYIIN